MTSVADVLAQLRRDPGRPRLTWYGPDHERVELSGHVLDNWVTKTANLLVEELDAAPGSRVAIELPVHWRTVVWALATWRTGATVVLGPDAAAGADVLVTDRPRAGEGAAQVAVALPALARSFPGPLAAGAVDAASAVMTYGDVLGWVPPADPAAPALEDRTSPVPGATTGAPVLHADLLAWAGTASSSPRARVLLEPRDAAVAPVLAAVLGALAADGSVVLCAPDVVQALAADPARRERIVATERVTPA